MLGLGAGSAVEILNKKCAWPIEITAIEFDEDLIAFARDEFEIERFGNLKIITADAIEWIKNNTGIKYDLIIDDLFIDDQMPSACLEKEYLAGVSGLLNDKGIYFRNTMNTSEITIQTYNSYLETIYKKVSFCRAKGYENLIYLCYN